MPERDRLLADFIGNDLADGEWERLMEHARQDGAFARHLLALAAQQPLLTDLLHGDDRAQRFVARVVAARPEPGDSRRFTAAVLARWRGRPRPSTVWRRAGWAALTAATLVAGIWLLYPASAARTAWLTVADGATAAVGTIPCPGGDERALRPDDRIAVSAGNADILADDGSRLHLAGGTEVVCRLEEGLVFELVTGRAEASVMPQPADRPFTIRTVDALIRVQGTRFAVERRDGATRVTVDTGRVLCTRRCDAAAITLAGGQQSVIAGPGPLTASPMPSTTVPVRRLIACPALAGATVRAGDGADQVQSPHGCLLTKWSVRSDANVRREIYLRFQLSEIPAPVREARLRLWVDHVYDPPFHVVVEVVAGDWNAATLTWNRRPDAGPAIATWIPVDRSLNEVDITTAVSAAVQAGHTQLSLRVRAIDQSANNSLVAFGSLSAAPERRPSLLVTTGP